MSAVPKKKLCWNCEGNVAREIDNCPYCGVYVNSADFEENNIWNISQNSEKFEEEIPSPIYEIPINNPVAHEEVANREAGLPLFKEFKQDVLPVLLLMSGSIFFLFGIVLFLFSQNGILTLQWNGDYWSYFLITSLPCVFFGWRYLLKMDPEE